MIPRYRVLAERLRTELSALEGVVNRVGEAFIRSKQQPPDAEFFLSAAALDLHGFYSGLERLFEMIGNDLDGKRPIGSRWHRELLAQMTLAVPGARPAVLTAETQAALTDYLEFRHIVRNVYTFDLRLKRVAELVQGLRPTFELARRDLLAFAVFLDDLSTADEG